MALIAGSEADLQSMINVMCEWMNEWKLKVNISKTKIVHFRGKRSPKTNFMFTYNNDPIEVVSCYKYLGVYLDEFLDYGKCVQVLADSASRALGCLITKIKHLKDCGYKTYTKLFDSGVLPVLHYSAEIWGYGPHTKCDTILNRAMRYYLGVHRYAPTPGVQGEMAWLSLKYRRYILMTKYWNRLIKLDNDRLTKKIFLWSYGQVAIGVNI